MGEAHEWPFVRVICLQLFWLKWPTSPALTLADSGERTRCKHLQVMWHVLCMIVTKMGLSVQYAVWMFPQSL